MSLYLDNFGRPSGVLPPIDISWIHPDNEDVVKEVDLMVGSGIPGPPRHYHWKLSWLVATTEDGLVHRRIEIVREIERDHLTNWGPYTKIGPVISANTHLHTIGALNLSQRRELERIAEQEPVRVPNGEWNCQDWIISVLQKAVQAGLFTRAECQSAIHKAGWKGDF
ncbi:hypothetical protein BOTBODRAFT_468965 [Botryobasidium botryosum FD-172 SS1]|uniref:Uncharacterized protein n=1 Tax=Botryobasidium botryosum (strain FD-172 SS1) TaxID=930990 RepID=A0A067MHD0_BOTB1|nr:hypothetical protein BOTBODRAFT_468965 [Botryobasidium botryosum FD-172 SS1]